MVLVRTAVVLLLVVVAELCLAAENEETPQTGTIEVEVVYKDTGEPVAGAEVCITSLEDPEAFSWTGPVYRMPDGAPGEYYVPMGSYLVDARNPWMGPSRFLYDGSVTGDVVTVSHDEPAARLRLEVERGWSFSGRVLKQDGTPLFAGVVHLLQGESPHSHVFGVTDQHGEFRILGVKPADKVAVRVYSGLDGRYWHTVHCEPLVLWEGHTTVAAPETSAEFTVTTADLSLTLVRLAPLWPFAPRHEPVVVCVQSDDSSWPEAGIWLSPHGRKRDTQPDVRIGLYSFASRCTSIRFPPKERWHVDVPDLPADTRLTIGAWDPERGGLGATRQTPHMYTTTVKSQPGAFDVELVMAAPRARLSRVFWCGVPSVLVLVVFGTILIKQMRKRRAKETAT